MGILSPPRVKEDNQYFLLDIYSTLQVINAFAGTNWLIEIEALATLFLVPSLESIKGISTKEALNEYW